MVSGLSPDLHPYYRVPPGNAKGILNESAYIEGQTKRAPTCSAPMEEYPGKNYQKAGYTIIIVSITEMSSGNYRGVTVSDI